ncbi:MAG: mannosyltransferase B-like protein [Parcubacteria group bacterium GW2011_GWC2_45_7]|nr:MAG: mannosyltransferase B-like protein [Parcubacteria group bacterium GW2011_GWC2_45_7]KKU74097.1 MAG: mannosyltransferase B-like protein [Parcubacteria group bacterium GW2011_GWA2_47_26]
MGIICAFALVPCASFGMKIAMTLLSGIGYGGVTYFNNLIPALGVVDRENEYHLFVPQGHSLITRMYKENFIFHECIKNNQSALKRFLWEQLILPFKLKEYKVDVLFTAKNLNVFLASCKTVISLRNMEPLAYQEYKNDWKLNAVLWIKLVLTKWSVRKADHVVAVSQAVKDRIIARIPDAEKKITVVYNGNPVPSPVPIAVEAPYPIGRGKGEDYILTASKFVAYSNQLNLLRGYAELVKRRSETPPLWFAGGVHDAKYFDKVRAYVENNKLTGRVGFLGLVSHDRLLELMSGASLFVFPSTLESCPHTLIEAMACGVPIVTSNTPPMPEICENSALYCDPNDPEDIANKIERVLSDSPLRERLVQNGLTHAEFFTWDKTARKLVKVFML